MKQNKEQLVKKAIALLEAKTGKKVVLKEAADKVELQQQLHTAVVIANRIYNKLNKADETLVDEDFEAISDRVASLNASLYQLEEELDSLIGPLTEETRATEMAKGKGRKWRATGR